MTVGSLGAGTASSVTLTGANHVGTLVGVTAASGAVALTDAQPLTVQGGISGSSIALATTGALTLTGGAISRARGQPDDDRRRPRR